MVMRRVRPHAFVPNPDLGTDHTGQRFCGACPLGEHHEIHDMPGQDAAVTEAESRKLGEKNGD